MSDIQDAIMQGMILGASQRLASANQMAAKIASGAIPANENNEILVSMKKLCHELKAADKEEARVLEERNHYKTEFQKAQKGYDELLKDYNCDIYRFAAQRDAAMDIIKDNMGALPYENYDEVCMYIDEKGDEAENATKRRHNY